MTAFTIQVDDRAVHDALNALKAKVADLRPMLQAIGEDVMERTKQRFATATGPDGAPWKPNAQGTMLGYITKASGKNFRKDGRLNAAGSARIMNKKPLKGQTGDLARQFHVSVSGNAVTIGNSMPYAAANQFGTKPHVILPRNKKALAFGGGIYRRVNHPGIPARPFLPVQPGGSLYPLERDTILAQIERYLAGLPAA